VVGPTWTVVFDGRLIACMKPMTLPPTADKAKARIELFLAREALSERMLMHIAHRAGRLSFDDRCAWPSRAAHLEE
jgi:hypothetical protein